MAFDSVPWFVGGGAEHSPDVARLLAHIATGGAAGVGGVHDLKVTQLPAATGIIRVAAGSCVIPNRYLGDSPAQSYVARAPSVTDLAVTPTGSQAGRSDMVVVRIDDPQFGGAQPADPVVGPYVRAEIIQNVASGATTVPSSINYPAVALARIDMPTNTATVTNAMITDLRSLAQPRRQRETLAVQPYAGTNYAELSSSTFVAFPSPFSPNIAVPSWATRMKVIVHVGAIAATVSQAIGQARLRFGDDYGPVTDFDLPDVAGSTQRFSQMLHMDIPVDHLAGGAATLSVEMRRTSGTGLPRAMRGTTVIADIEFLERPI